MDAATQTALTQLGLAAIFAIACVQLFLRLEDKNAVFIAYLIETISALRKQNELLSEQNKQLSLALFANNPDAQRAFVALNQKPVKFDPIPTDIG